MAGYVVCGCCGRRVPAAAADVGLAVVCPVSRQLVMVTPANYREDPAETADPPRRRTALVLVPLLLVGAGTAVYFWGPFGRNANDPPPANEPLAPAAVAAVTDPAAAAVTPTTAPSEDDPAIAPAPRPVTRAAAGPVAPPISPSATAGNTPADSPRPGTTVPPAGAATDPLLPPGTTGSPTPPTPPAVGGGDPVVITPRAPRPATPAPPAPPMAKAPPPGDVAARPPGKAADARGLAVFRLAKRIDTRTAEELQRELLGLREVGLDRTPAREASSLLVALGNARRAAGLAYPGSAVVARGRPDLAGLPYRLGPDASLSKAEAEALHALSRQLRGRLRECVADPATDPRPDPDKLFAALLAGKGGAIRDGKWASAEAVPCVQQMLQPMDKAVRRMAVELLRQLHGPRATDALVQWAVFDLDADNRAAAVDALRARDKAQINALLLGLLRHPWPRAAEHAAEALVELRATTLIPDLAALLALPDPDAPQTVPLAGSAAGFRREVVRVNHLRNCLLCHPPSGSTTDLVRGLVPDATQPPPPAYYEGRGQFVHAAATYLKQDFSCELAVPDAGVWPAYQRFDFMVVVRPARAGEPAGDPAYRAAVLFALRELSGKDLGGEAAGWAVLLNGRTPPDDRLLGAVSRFLALSGNPDPLLILALREFGGSFLRLAEAEQTVVITGLRRRYGGRAVWYALIGYLDWVTRAGDPSARPRAAALLEQYLRIADPDAVGGVIDPDAAVRLLTNANPHLRAAAAQALGTLGAKAKDRYRDLLKALKDPEADVRLAAAAALGELDVAPDEVHLALAAMTRDAVGRVRVGAAAALGKLKFSPRAAAKPLAEGLVRRQTWDAPEEWAEFEKAATAALLGMKGRNAGAHAVVVSAAAGDTATDLTAATLAKLLAAVGPAADAASLKALVGLLGRAEFKAVAETHLLAAGDDGVAPLIAGLKDESVKVRAAAATLLGKSAVVNRTPGATRGSWRSAMDALATAKATDTSADVRAAAATALTQLTAGQ